MQEQSMPAPQPWYPHHAFTDDANVASPSFHVHSTTVDMRHLEQHLNVAFTSNDPAIIAEAWAAINAARAQSAAASAAADEARSVAISIAHEADRRILAAQSAADFRVAEAQRTIQDAEEARRAAVAQSNPATTGFPVSHGPSRPSAGDFFHFSRGC